MNDYDLSKILIRTKRHRAIADANDSGGNERDIMRAERGLRSIARVSDE